MALVVCWMLNPSKVESLGLRQRCAGAITIFAAMPRSRHPLPVPTWTCPHCGFVHRPADLLRLDSDNLQCRQCGRAFPAVPEGDHPKADHPSETKTES